MTPSIPFGRRIPPASAPAPAPRPPAAPSPEAEALRRELAGAVGAPSDFTRWRNHTRPARWAAWGLSFALMGSGVGSYLLHAPIGVSGLLEVGGWGLGVWLRRARRARLAAVRAWEAEHPA